MAATFTHDGSFIPSGPDKDPDSDIDYGCDWTDWLEAGETITGSAWVVPAGLVAGTEANDTTTTSIFLTGGTVGTTYTLTNRITTSDSRIEDRSMFILCAQK